MRDVRTGDISAGRDVVINDQSGQPKLLAQCTNEELLEEEKHRRCILRKENSRRMRSHVRVLVVGVLLFLVAVAWFYVQGDFDLVSLLTNAGSIFDMVGLFIGVGGIGLGVATLKAMGQLTDFQIRQQAVLHEINMILRERGFR